MREVPSFHLSPECVGQIVISLQFEIGGRQFSAESEGEYRKIVRRELQARGFTASFFGKHRLNVRVRPRQQCPFCAASIKEMETGSDEFDGVELVAQNLKCGKCKKWSDSRQWIDAPQPPAAEQIGG